MIYLANAFSLQMIAPDPVANVRITRSNPGAVRAILSEGWYTSAVGHADTAAVFEALLGTEVVAQRVNVALTSEDLLIVGQITGGRLPEGAHTLPEGAHIDWLLVRLID